MAKEPYWQLAKTVGGRIIAEGCYVWVHGRPFENTGPGLLTDTKRSTIVGYLTHIDTRRGRPVILRAAIAELLPVFAAKEEVRTVVFSKKLVTETLKTPPRQLLAAYGEVSCEA